MQVKIVHWRSYFSTTGAVTGPQCLLAINSVAASCQRQHAKQCGFKTQQAKQRGFKTPRARSRDATRDIPMKENPAPRYCTANHAWRNLCGESTPFASRGIRQSHRPGPARTLPGSPPPGSAAAPRRPLAGGRVLSKTRPTRNADSDAARSSRTMIQRVEGQPRPGPSLSRRDHTRSRPLKHGGSGLAESRGHLKSALTRAASRRAIAGRPTALPHCQGPGLADWRRPGPGRASAVGCRRSPRSRAQAAAASRRRRAFHPLRARSRWACSGWDGCRASRRPAAGGRHVRRGRGGA